MIDPDEQIEEFIPPPEVLDAMEKMAEDESINNGGKTDYYQLRFAPFPINDADDFAEWRKMNFAQGNMLKVCWTFNVGRHDGTSYRRELNKLKHYADRELQRLDREGL